MEYPLQAQVYPKCCLTNVDMDDMLVLEFALDHTQINIQRKDNPWLSRAALSLAEAIRLTASKPLDIEFTELVAGYVSETLPESVRAWPFRPCCCSCIYKTEWGRWYRGQSS